MKMKKIFQLKYFTTLNNQNKIKGIFFDKQILSSFTSSKEQEEEEEQEEQQQEEKKNNEIEGLTTITGKYSTRLRNKGISPFELFLRKNPRGDASLLRSAKESVNKYNPIIISNQEMVKILKYIESRGIFSWIYINKNESIEYLDELTKTISNLKNVTLLNENDLQINHHDEIDLTKLANSIQSKILFPSYQTLIVSSNNKLIEHFNNLDYITAKYRYQPNTGFQRSTYKIDEVSEIQTIIEDINGISFR